MRYNYSVYGLNVASDMPFSELAAGAGDATDVKIVRTTRDADLLQEIDRRTFRFDASESMMAWPQVGVFRIHADGLIEVTLVPDVDFDTVALPLFGPVIGVFLLLSGTLSLHASAVSVGGRAVLFLGVKGAGKSTTAASFVKLGHRLISDDVAVLRRDGPSAWQVVPGSDRIKLWGDAAAQLEMKDPVGFAGANETVDKHQYQTGHHFGDSAASLAMICLLERTGEAALRPMDPSDRLLALIANTYGTIFAAELLEGPCARQHFEACSALASSDVRFVTLGVPTKVTELPRIVRMIEDELHLAPEPPSSLGDRDLSGHARGVS